MFCLQARWEPLSCKAVAPEAWQSPMFSKLFLLAVLSNTRAVIISRKAPMPPQIHGGPLPDRFLLSCPTHGVPPVASLQDCRWSGEKGHSQISLTWVFPGSLFPGHLSHLAFPRGEKKILGGSPAKSLPCTPGCFWGPLVSTFFLSLLNLMKKLVRAHPPHLSNFSRD
ncbi:hypothetical protein GWK47_013846 [Chionoecetes opilio]|uniref:Uncharacterized protein n=1 Tax=Chionoecetes opilio TaxID=41210 RepID=A0A8J4Y0P1_CHIOP|nr:hypothetical protein GWK47_013846 [Chionoecetes opilio]